MTNFTLPFLETMITQVCNLSCEGCTNYSDITHSGYVGWAEGKRSLTDWLEKINILEFGIIGGEPLINPEWREWVFGVRELLPAARIRFTTNGLLLHKHADIVNFLETIGNVTFKITQHLYDNNLQQQLEKIMSARTWRPVTEFGIRRWNGPNGLKLQINRPSEFIKTYKNSYHDMMPWNSDPILAFNNCCQQTCPLLFNHRIYKCSTAGLLTQTLSTFNFPNKAMWQPYVDHGVGIDSSDKDIQKFIENFGRPNAICAQCPTILDSGNKINHLMRVHKK
jgi:organic radical activating enzyme